MNRNDELKHLHNELSDLRQSILFARTNGLPIIKELREQEQEIKNTIMELSTND